MNERGPYMYTSDMNSLRFSDPIVGQTLFLALYLLM